MNEKIKELKNAAIFSVDGDCGDLVIPDAFAEKFAELIVQECVLEAMDAIHHDTSIRLQIYKHFGIDL